MNNNTAIIPCLNLSAWLVIFIFFLAGCASEQPRLSQEQAKNARQAYVKKRAYNRPYQVRGKTYYPLASGEGYNEIGMASWYGYESGSTTAMGGRFDPEGLSAAHKTLPLPSRVRVTNLANGRSAIIIVNDRGPFHPGRIIDLSRGAARQIGMAGVSRVKVEFVGNP